MNPVLATCFVTLMLISKPLQSTAAKGKLEAEVAVRQVFQCSFWAQSVA